MPDKPLYEHDCEACYFLGSFNGDDLYYCGQAGVVDTVIARHSSEGHDYGSGLSFGMFHKNDMNHPLGEAYRRVLAKGLL
jgi:hypothetical protein